VDQLFDEPPDPFADGALDRIKGHPSPKSGSSPLRVVSLGRELINTPVDGLPESALES
jgi:hypothetical protein